MEIVSEEDLPEEKTFEKKYQVELIHLLFAGEQYKIDWFDDTKLDYNQLNSFILELIEIAKKKETPEFRNAYRELCLTVLELCVLEFSDKREGNIDYSLLEQIKTIPF